MDNCKGWQFFVLPAELFPPFSKISKHAGWNKGWNFSKKIIRFAAELFGRSEYLSKYI